MTTKNWPTLEGEEGFSFVECKQQLRYDCSINLSHVIYDIGAWISADSKYGHDGTDTERKTDEDNNEYSHQQINSQAATQQSEPITKETMKKREIPTLAFLAGRIHKNATSPVNNVNSQLSEDEQKRKTEMRRNSGSRDDPEEQFPKEETVCASVVNGEPSSGRTSSLGGDSSGVGSSLTSASSAEPIEREALSPSSEHDGNGDSVVEDVSANIHINTESHINGENSTDIPKEASTSCSALLLAEEFNGQMTAAKKFLQMVRDGIKEKDADENHITTKGGELNSGDEEPKTKPVILRSTNSSNTNFNTEKSTAGRPNNAHNLHASKPNGVVSHPNAEKEPPPECVQDVWAHNLIEEFAKIRQVVKKYTYIAMDTEFPGIVVRPQSSVRPGGVFPYELLKSNVDRLKIIQLGVTFMDKFGQTPAGVCTWQFNFEFSLNKDMYASDSISLLSRCGIQFEKHAAMGIDPRLFGEYFMSSGMVTSDEVTYLTFHSGFDFGYLIKLLSCLPLPDNEDTFFEVMKLYFPNVYDLKFLMKSVDLHGGLQDIANQMGQERIGIQHQAGSDSLLTGMTFFKLLCSDVFNGDIDRAKYCGKLYGFHMTSDGKDEGLIPGEILDSATSPKPMYQTSRINNPASSSINNGNNNVTPRSSEQTSPSSSTSAVR